MLWVSIIIALIALIIGSITDIKKREVNDYLSYGLIIISFGISIIYSVLTGTAYILQTVMGFIIGLGIAYAMFYLGQWGGGDSKLLMGLGAVFGFNVIENNLFGEKNLSLILFLINIIIAGAIYGLIYSIFLAVKNRKNFLKNLNSWIEKKEIRIARMTLLGFTIITILIILFYVPVEYKIIFLGLVSMLFFIFYMWLFVKIIEESCMIKKISVKKLTEGDWIYENIYTGKKYIAGPKDLGISKEQIELLKKSNIKKVLIKEGIPFIPAFLIAFILTIIMYYILRIPNIFF